MKILIAPNAFKGSLAAIEAARAIESGLKRIKGNFEIEVLPVADGGDGLVEAFLSAKIAGRRRARVSDPLGRRIVAGFAYMREKKTAVVEMALASGLALLKDGERNPMMATSRGTGELILHAVRAGARKVILGIGGSATCEGGIGALSALGVKFLDKSGRELDAIPENLREIRKLDCSRVDRSVASLEIQIACDVENPLLGAEGAARVYAPQKGADKAQVLQLEKGLANFARVVEACTGVGIAGMRGAGAAGGVGGAFHAILGARMSKGTDIVFDALDVERKIRGSDLVFTGEGRIDFQTAFGKAPAEIAKIARRHGVRCIALCGSLGDDAGRLHEIGMDAIFPTCRGPASLEYAMRNARRLLASAAEEAMRAFLAGFIR